MVELQLIGARVGATFLPRQGEPKGCKDNEVVHEESRAMKTSHKADGDKGNLVDRD